MSKDQPEEHIAGYTGYCIGGPLHGNTITATKAYFRVASRSGRWGDKNDDAVLYSAAEYRYSHLRLESATANVFISQTLTAAEALRALLPDLNIPRN